MKRSVPRLGIGLPVYNGERYLAEAIESILAQTFDDFELIICDNASTDRTAEICKGFAARDARVHYHRNQTNLGAAPNYNRTFELSSSEYFRWAAHDDVLAPTLLEKCIAALDADPGAVLCQSLVELIDTESEVRGTYDSALRGTVSDRASDRFAAVALRVHMCTEFFGVIRRSALEGSPLHGTYPGTDQVLLAVLALRGRFIQIREPLFRNRAHPERYSAGVAIHERAAWHDSSKAGKIEYGLWRQYTEYVRQVRLHPLSPGDRWRCYGHLARWWFVNWNAARMLIDILASHNPKILILASRAKRRFIGRKDLGFDWDHWHRDAGD